MIGKIALGVLGIGAIAYGAFCLALWRGQTRLIFYPQPPPAQTPAEFGLFYEDVWIEVEEDTIHGWWIPHSNPQARTALVLHGNASNVETTLRWAKNLIAADLALLIVDYRGYGRSSGPFPNEARVYADAAAAWQYLTQERQIPPSNIVVFGHSIGGAIAIELARHHPTAGGLIVQSTFTSMADMMDFVGYSRLIPKPLLNQHFDSHSKIAELQMPALFIHGVEDVTVPATMSQHLYDAYPGPKELWLVPQADHNDIADITTYQYVDRIQRWLKSLPQADAPTQVHP